MATDRRYFLRAAASLAALAALHGRDARARGEGGLFVSARGDANGAYHVTGFRPDGAVALDLDLPGRGHGSAFAPDGRVVHFARRPGRYALVLDPQQGRVEHVIESLEGRHFEGHGAFAPDGRLLYATENVYEAARGVIGVYDTGDGWRRVAEFDTGGMDPHEMQLMPDGETLVVANGGILTHPDYPQENLDPAGMDPSLAYLDRRDGRLISIHRLAPELRQLSFHHLAVARDGTVFVVLQDAIRRAEAAPLIVSHRQGAALEPVDPGEGELRRLRGYCGSVALDGRERILATTSPRGGVVLFWDRETRQVAGGLELADVCGVAPAGPAGVFVVTSGIGGVLLYDVARARSLKLAAPVFAGSHWDNHVFAAPA